MFWHAFHGILFQSNDTYHAQIGVIPLARL